jgi:hypothetical protein
LQSNGIACKSILASRGFFITLALPFSRLEDDPSKNKALVRCRVYQPRERHLPFDVEVLANTFPIFQGAPVRTFPK